MQGIDWTKPRERTRQNPTCKFCSNPIQAKMSYFIQTVGQEGDKSITVASKSINVCRNHAELLYPDIETLLAEGKF